MTTPTDRSKAATVEAGPESPTTARPLEMDDDDVQDTGVLEPSSGTAPAAAATRTGAAAAGAADEPAPPPKPPRPVSEQQKNQMMLKEAFPTIEESVIKAVLSASGGRIDPAFNALLEMTDPDAASREVEDTPPPQPPRPSAAAAGATPQSQLEADELYARQLAQHYENVGAYEARTSSRSGGGGGARPPRQQTGLDMNRNFRGDQHDDREHSFIDDDLPVIRENLRKGFNETQKTVNTWFQTMKKRFDDEFNDEDDRPQQQQFRQQQGQGPVHRPGGRQSTDGRRSGDYDRYDADPQVLSDDFAGIKLHSDGTPARDTRASPNPHLFRPPPPSSSPKPGGNGDGRKVGFRDSVEEIDDPYSVSPRVPPKDAQSAGSAGTKSSKWQPLSTMEPSPIAENDPFSLGDSDDEKDASGAGHKKTSSTGGASAGGGSGEIKMEDAERLRAAAAEAMNDSIVGHDKKPGAADAKS